MELVSKDFTREQASAYIYENARRQTDDLEAIGRIAKKPIEYAGVEPGKMRSPLKNSEQLSFIECGAKGGRFSAIIPRFVSIT